LQLFRRGLLRQVLHPQTTDAHVASNSDPDASTSDGEGTAKRFKKASEKPDPGEMQQQTLLEKHSEMMKHAAGKRAKCAWGNSRSVADENGGESATDKQLKEEQRLLESVAPGSGKNRVSLACQ
jgi:hypothetical protein